MCVLYLLYYKQKNQKRTYVCSLSAIIITIKVKKFITFTVLWLLQLRMENLLHLCSKFFITVIYYIYGWNLLHLRLLAIFITFTVIYNFITFMGPTHVHVP